MDFGKVCHIVGNKKELYKDLVDFLQTNYQPQVKFTFSKKSGWTVFFRKGGKPLCYINLQENGFTVTVVIGVTLSDKVSKCGVSENTKQMFNVAKQHFDGKWLHFDVTNRDQIKDIKELLLIKKNPIKQK